MPQVEYYSLSQFDPQPSNWKELSALIEMGKAEKVSEDYDPTWGGGVYMHIVGSNDVKQFKHNWDSSD